MITTILASAVGVASVWLAYRRGRIDGALAEKRRHIAETRVLLRAMVVQAMVTDTHRRGLSAQREERPS